MRAFRSFAALAATAIVALGIAPMANADSYFDQAGQQVAQSYVWEDPSVTLVSSAQVAALQQLIQANTEKPVYVAILNKDSITADNKTLPKLLHGAVNKNGVYVVVTAKTFRAAGYQVPSEVADNAPGLATDMVSDAKTQRGLKAPDYQLINDYIAQVRAISFTPDTNPPKKPVVHSEGNPVVGSAGSESNSFPWKWVILGLILLAVAFGIYVWAVNRRGKKSDVYLQDYQQARQYEASTATRYYGSSGPQDTPRRSAHDEDDIDLSHYRPSSTRTTTNNHYYSGGSYNGQNYGPGYYSDPFWNWVMMDTLLNHHNQNGSYSQGFTDGEHHADEQQPQHESESSTGNDNSWDNSDSDSDNSGGGDFDNDSSSRDSYTAPSYTPAPSQSWSAPDPTPSPSWDFGGGSSGGGFDSGSSGGGDF